MEQEDKEEEFQRLWQRRQEKWRGIIAIMGPPYTMKTLLAKRIGSWAKCPVLCIQDFLSPAATDDIRKNAASDVEVLQHAFANLCKVAHRNTRPLAIHPEYIVPGILDIDSLVVIKSRLNSTFELQRLLHLASRTKTNYFSEYALLIIECRFTNEYLRKQHFPCASRCSKILEDDCSWYRPRSWKEMEKARDDYYQAQAQAHWDLHLQQLVLKPDSPSLIRRLVVDPSDILTFSDYNYLPKNYLLNDFTDSIKYLLTRPDRELINNSQNPHCYTVEFRELRLYLFEKRIDAILAAKGRSNDLCPMGECIFKYWEELTDINHVCWACDKQVDSGTPAYTCRLCILTLHKSCAERIHFKALRFNLEMLRNVGYYDLLISNCRTGAFQEHLKCGLIPTIISHNSHPPHFFSLMLSIQAYRCRACGEYAFGYFYCCKPCGLYYHMECAFLPLELHKHEHGGHEHVMKLLYSHHDTDDDKEPEESYWCEVCYKDMDPQGWLYSCKDCHYYSAHLRCARGYKYLGNVKNAKFVRQIQSQLEDAMAETCADSEIHDKE